MATTQRGIYYNTDYTAEADILEDERLMAESVDEALENINISEQSIVDLENNQLTGPSSGTNIYIADSADYTIRDIGIKGNSVQNGTPTTSSPIDIDSAGDSGNITEKVVNKNVFDKTDLINAYLDGNGNPVANNSFRVTDFIPVPSSITNIVIIGNSGSGEVIGFYNENKEKIQTTGTGANVNYLINKPNNTVYIRATIKATAIDSYAIYFNATTSDNYITHQEQDFTIPCQQPMRSIGDVRDEFVKQNEVWYERHNIASAVLDGSDTSYNGGTTGTNAYYLVTNLSGAADNSKSTAYSNMFKPCSFNDRANGLDIIYSQDGSIILRTANNTEIDWSNSTNRKNWLIANKPEVTYLPITPTDLLCTQEQITVLNAIEKARTYKNTTNILSEDITPAYVETTYVKDLETVINNLSS